MKNGLGTVLIGIIVLILISCAGSPEPDFSPETGFDIILQDTPEEQPDGQAGSSAPANPSESDGTITETDEETKTGSIESEEDSAESVSPEAGSPAPAEEKVSKAEKGAAEKPKKPESSKPRLKGFPDSAPADRSKAVSAGTTDSAAMSTDEDASALPPPNPLLTDSQAIRPSAVPETGGEKAASPAAAPSPSGVGDGVPAKPAGAAAGTPGTTPTVPSAPIASAAPPPAAKAPAPAAAVPPSSAVSPSSPAFTNPLLARPDKPSTPLKDPAAAAAAPSRLLDSPGEFTVTLAGQGWIFRSDLSTPGSWRFLERIRKGDSTGFRFQFTESGEWSLVFERQDPSSGSSERQSRLVRVGDNGGTTVAANGPIPQKAENPISGELPRDPETRNIAAEEALAKGDIEGALEFWERDAADPGPAGRRARKAIVEIASGSGSVRHLIAWLPAYIRDGADIDTLAAALKVFESQAGYDRQSMVILENLTRMDQSDRLPEWLYRQASILEKPGPDRDLDRAAMLYQQVITQWPLSPWRDLSEERLLWLKRHYFRVR